MSYPIAFSPAAVHPPSSHDCLSSSMPLKSCIVSSLSLPPSQSRIKPPSSKQASRMSIRCEVAIKSTDSANAKTDPSSSDEEIEAEAKAKVGSRVKVTAPLKVYHVNRVPEPEVDLEGMEGILKDYVAVWKGKRISANLPYKVEFFKEIEGRGNVKFVAHLKEDEFEFIDP